MSIHYIFYAFNNFTILRYFTDLACRRLREKERAAAQIFHDPSAAQHDR